MPVSVRMALMRISAEAETACTSRSTGSGRCPRPERRKRMVALGEAIDDGSAARPPGGCRSHRQSARKRFARAVRWSVVSCLWSCQHALFFRQLSENATASRLEKLRGADRCEWRKVGRGAHAGQRNQRHLRPRWLHRPAAVVQRGRGAGPRDLEQTEASTASCTINTRCTRCCARPGRSQPTPSCWMSRHPRPEHPALQHLLYRQEAGATYVVASGSDLLGPEQRQPGVGVGRFPATAKAAACGLPGSHKTGRYGRKDRRP